MTAAASRASVGQRINDTSSRMVNPSMTPAKRSRPGQMSRGGPKPCTRVMK
ncbi:hypothetical protein [Methylocystis parvus]|uniref:hypothetical protein n=1 Tax=Methylocystis parvus TaxID=134 RepID=UPI0003708F17|nr:hypothetical protein [Methylocystis parvus]WBK01979.1 hypothetical protein MMG94_09865 [Methylocystis parvus OBBP]